MYYTTIPATRKMMDNFYKLKNLGNLKSNLLYSAGREDKFIHYPTHIAQENLRRSNSLKSLQNLRIEICPFSAPHKSLPDLIFNWEFFRLNDESIIIFFSTSQTDVVPGIVVLQPTNNQLDKFQANMEDLIRENPNFPALLNGFQRKPTFIWSLPPQQGMIEYRKFLEKQIRPEILKMWDKYENPKNDIGYDLNFGQNPTTNFQKSISFDCSTSKYLQTSAEIQGKIMNKFQKFLSHCKSFDIDSSVHGIARIDIMYVESNSDLYITEKIIKVLLPKIANSEIPNKTEIRISIGVSSQQNLENLKQLFFDYKNFSIINLSIIPIIDYGISEPKHPFISNFYIHHDVPIDSFVPFSSFSGIINEDDSKTFVYETSSRMFGESLKYAFNLHWKSAHPFLISNIEEFNISYLKSLFTFWQTGEK
ncbi:MAG: hypothetical protein ACTSYI_17755 [Promethearchaeota archaeon]